MKKLNLTRRKFFTSSALGMAGLMMPRIAKGTQKVINTEEETILYRTLGKTGIKVPVISCGRVDPKSPNIVRAAVDKGIMHFDTARVYNNGDNEAFLGKVLKEFDREKVVVATKLKANKSNQMFTENVTTESLLEQLDFCLEQLQMDYIDILYIHGLAKKEAVTYQPMLDALLKAKEQGKAKAVGVSTHTNMAEVIHSAIDTGVYDIVLTTYNYQLTEDLGMEEALQRAGEAGIGIVAMKTQAGKYLDKEQTKPVNDKAAIKWVLKNPNVHTVILSIKTFDKLEEYFSIMNDPELTKDEIQELQASAKEPSMFCFGCEQCVKQCKKSLPIPDLMRAYMYTYGYGETKKGYELLHKLDLNNSACESCGNCTVQCRHDFNIAQKVTDIIRLKDVPEEFLV